MTRRKSAAEYIAGQVEVKEPRKKPVRHEDILHKKVAVWLRAVIGREGKTTPNGILWHSTENRAKRSLREGASNRSRGCVAGFPLDIDFYYNMRAFKIELKSETGKVSDSQKISIPEYRAAGVPVSICYSVEDVRIALRQWNIPTEEITASGIPF